VLIPGVTNTVHLWLTDTVFINHGPCIALSLPGHYPSTFPPDFQAGSFTAEMIFRVLGEAICELTNGHPVTLVGYSTGGFAALGTAARRPDLVRRVISIAGFVQGRWTGVFGLGQWAARHGPIGRMLFKLGFEISGANRFTFRNFWRFLAADADALFAYSGFETLVNDFYPNFKRLDLEAMLYYFGICPEFDISPLLPQISGPTLALAGERDPIVPPAQSRLIAHQVPRADLALIEGAGHLVFAERPAEYRRILDDWLG
jgi:pimeloyl-ACP methyl ester carboxylesterase